MENNFQTIGEELDKKKVKSMDIRNFKVHVKARVKEAALRHLQANRQNN